VTIRELVEAYKQGKFSKYYGNRDFSNEPDTVIVKAIKNGRTGIILKGEFTDATPNYDKSVYQEICLKRDFKKALEESQWDHLDEENRPCKLMLEPDSTGMIVVVYKNDPTVYCCCNKDSVRKVPLMPDIGELLAGAEIVSGVTQWFEFPRYKVCAHHYSGYTFFVEVLNEKGEVISHAKFDLTDSQWKRFN